MTGHIFIEGEIGSDVTVKTVRANIQDYPQAKDFQVHFNSGGGDVYEGYAIGGVLQDLSRKGIKTVAKINSLCASIATYDALCCDSVEMGEHGDFMIHLPTGTLTGTAEDLRKGAAQLDRIKSELIDRYLPRVARKGVTREQLSAMIDKETSMSPQEAENMGFIDTVVPKMKAVARIDTKKFDMEKSVTKEEVEGMFEKWGKKFDALFKKTFKNISVTLADGSTVNSDAADPESLVGSTLTDEQGAPLAPGTYETMDGYALVIATPDGKVASADPITADKTTDAEAMKKENEALKKQLADLTAAANETKKVAEVAAAQTKEFKNIALEFKTLKEDYEKLKNETFGDKTVVIDAPDKTKRTEQKIEHPLIMAIANDLGNAYTSSRFK